MKNFNSDTKVNQPSRYPFVREEGIDKPEGKPSSIPNSPRAKDNSSIYDISETFTDEE